MSSDTRIPNKAVGFDIGGTTSRAGVVDDAGQVRDFLSRPTPGGAGELITFILSEYKKKAQVDGVAMPLGVALPGVVNSSRGVCTRCVNLPWLEGQPIRELVLERLGIGPAVMSDSHAATWAQYLACRRPVFPFAHLRLGTGAACGIVVDGELLSMDPQRRTHMPVLVVDDGADAPQCRCGLRGCLEVFAGGVALGRQARHAGFDDLADLERGCDQGQEGALNIVDRAAIAVSRAITNLRQAHGVAKVMVGGGVLHPLPSLFDRIREAIAKSGEAVEIVPDGLGDQAGVIGAAQLARKGPS